MNIKRIFQKLQIILYGDSNSIDNELEKIVNGETTNSTFNIPEDVPCIYHSQLYEPPMNIDNIISERFNSKMDNNENHTSMNNMASDNQVPQEKDEFELSNHEKQDLLDEDIDNGLLIDLANLIEELDVVKDRIIQNESKEIIQFCQERIIECMTKNSVDIIDSDETFDIEKHKAVPFRIVPEGTKINKIIRPGIKYGSKIILKAQVELSEFI